MLYGAAVFKQCAMAHFQEPFPAPSTYLNLTQALLSHNRSMFEVLLLCDDGNAQPIHVQVAIEHTPLLVPYLILLRDFSQHPLHTEQPVVPVIRNAEGVWAFCGASARSDQEPVPPEPGFPIVTPLTCTSKADSAFNLSR